MKGQLTDFAACHKPLVLKHKPRATEKTALAKQFYERNRILQFHLP
jgi:hypothetical protein